MPSDLALFLRQLARNPAQTSAVVPSSGRLARAMAMGLGPKCGRVVEFGPGTGVITRAILKAGVHPQDLTLFEMNPDFAAHLRGVFAGVTVHNAGAQNAGRHCPTGVGTVISGLPLLSMPVPVRHAIIGGAFEVLRPGGVLVQFTYGAKPPLDPQTLDLLGLTFERRTKVWLNLPPATVYIFRRRADVG